LLRLIDEFDVFIELPTEFKLTLTFQSGILRT